MVADTPGHENLVLTSPGDTAARRHELAAYYDKAVLSRAGFVCASEATCRGSVEHKPGVGFFEGQLPYLGGHYDTTLPGGATMRVLVVPMETGREWQQTGMDDFTAVIRRRASERFSERNNHMRGVTFALRLAFGLGLGDDRAGEYLSTPDGALHVFDAYAMVNATLCSAIKVGTTDSRQSAVMRQKCARHLKAAVRLLEPTMLISQGVEVGKHLAGVFTVRARRTPTVASCRLLGHEFIWVDLAHPTARAPQSWSWLTHPYLHEVVEPSITLARQLACETEA
jgi:hypothetical protein